MEQHGTSSGTAEDEFLTYSESAARLRTTPRTIKKWAAEGRLPVHRFSPKIVRIRRSDLEALGRPAGDG